MSTLMVRTWLLVAVAVIVGLIIAVSGGDTEASGRPDADGVVEVVIEDYRFHPDELFLPVEEPLHLVFENRGDNAHRIWFGREVVEEEGVEACFEEDLFTDLSPAIVPERTRRASDDGAVGFVIDPDETVTVSVVLPADREGEWSLGCFSARGAHYRAGLSGTVHVEAAR
jgi:hypothetical protein